MNKSQAVISLFDAWLSYEAHLQATFPQKKAESLIVQTRTALLRYTLPGWGFSLPKGQRLTAQEREQGLQFLKQIQIEQLHEARDLQEKSFEALNVAGNSRQNYRWALNGFIDWCKQQTWASSVPWAEKKRRATRKRKQKRFAVDRSTTPALTWPEFLESVELLRAECKPRFLLSTQSKRGGSTPGQLRSLSAIAQSYQRFLCVALLAYIPPQRLGELQHLKISLPPSSDLKHDANVHGRENLIYYDENQWWIRIINTKQDQMPDRLIPIPNLGYDNNRCFYQYLEEWLLHYECRNDQAETLSFPGLRSCLNPQHDYLFTMKNGQAYAGPRLGMLFTHAVGHVTGKLASSSLVTRMFLAHVGAESTLTPGFGE
ncbi:MAG TPA: hypothetical protein V6C84_16105 [Coleofasciculaceae cyanobacterium]|jgi:hypothetical protein